MTGSSFPSAKVLEKTELWHFKLAKDLGSRYLRAYFLRTDDDEVCGEER
jgi:hypothetical protein